MANICNYTYDPNILTQHKVNLQFALFHKHLCYLESLSASGTGPTAGVSGQQLVSNGPTTPSSFQTLYTKGTANFTANGVITTVTIVHGLGSTPSEFFLNTLQPVTQNLLNRTITLNATNAVITYGVAPLNGENATYHWLAFK